MFTLPPLPYDYAVLEPWIDTETMKIHHDKHHQAYVDNLNKALEGNSELMDKPLEWLLTNLDNVPENIRTKVRNNGGGHFNHSLFWTLMARPNSSFEFEKLTVVQDIIKSFESVDGFKKQFEAAALGRFGSGWVWLISVDSTLKIIDTPNQDNPLMVKEIAGGKILLALDVWEHAYYLKYQNRRAEYVQAWWNVVNWQAVEKLFTS